jgi:hypothetical protein
MTYGKPILLLALTAMSYEVFSQPSEDPQHISEKKSLIYNQAREAKQINAVGRAVRGAMKNLPAYIPGKESMEEELLSNIEKHKEKSKSRTIMAGLVRKKLEQGIDEQLKKFASAQPEIPSTLLEQVKNAKRADIESRIEQLTSLDKRFTDTFEAARDSANRYLFAKISKLVYPSAEQIEEYHKLGGVPEKALNGLVRRAYLANPLFEEIENIIRAHIAKVINHGNNQLEQQMEILSRSKDDRYIERHEIISYLQRQVNDVVKPAPGFHDEEGPSYGVFPSVTARIAPHAGKLEKEQFESYFRRQISDCSIFVNPIKVKLASASYEALPQTKTQHKQQTVQVLADSVEQELIDRYAGGYKSSKEHHEKRKNEFTKNIKKYAMEEALASKYDKALDGCLGAYLTEYRAGMASAELRDKIPTVERETYEIKEEVVSRMAGTDDAGLRDGDFPSPRGLHLSETKELFQKKKQKIISEAKNALLEQMSIVVAKKPETVNEIKNVGGAPTKKQRIRIRDRYIQEVTSDWDTAGRKMLNVQRFNNSLRYEKLFGAVIDRIDEIITIEWNKRTQIAEVQRKKKEESQQKLVTLTNEGNGDDTGGGPGDGGGSEAGNEPNNGGDGNSGLDSGFSTALVEKMDSDSEMCKVSSRCRAALQECFGVLPSRDNKSAVLSQHGIQACESARVVCKGYF